MRIIMRIPAQFRSLSVVVGAFFALSVGTAVAAPTQSVPKKSIGLVLVTWAPAVYETHDGKLECPNGLPATNRDNWLLQFPTEEERARVNEKYVHLGPGGPASTKAPTWYLQNRGPQGQNIAFNPTAVEDSLPLREAQGKISYGLNLDGTIDGRGTAKTCEHEKFSSPEGEQGIDNQLYRVIGCSRGWRKGGFNVEYHGPQFMTSSIDRILIEISNVSDERNDEHVVVKLYKGIDSIPLDAAGKPIPYLPQRIDVRF